MAESGKKRLSKLARELNVGINTIVEFLQKKGVDIDANPNNKVDKEHVDMLYKQYKADFNLKKETDKISSLRKLIKKKAVSLRDKDDEEEQDDIVDDDKDVPEDILHIQDRTSKIITEEIKPAKIEEPVKPKQKEEVEFIEEKNILDGPKVVGKIEIEEKIAKKPVVKKEEKLKDEQESPVEKIETPEIKVEKQEKEKQEVKKELVDEVEEKAKEKAKEKPKEDLKEDKSKEPISKEPKKESIIEISKDTLEKVVEPKKKANTKTIASSVKPVRKKLVLKKKVDLENQEKKKNETLKNQEDKKLADEKNKQAEVKETVFRTKIEQLSGPTVIGKIDLPVKEKKKEQDKRNKKKKRKRIRKDHVNISGFQDQPKKVIKVGDKKVATTQNKTQNNRTQVGNKRLKQVKKKHHRQDPLLKREVNEEDVQKKVKETLARLQSKGKSKASKFRRQKRDNVEKKHQEEIERQEEESKVLQVTEFIPVSELASLMEVQVNDVISTCMSLGAMVSINQRLEADLLTLVAEEFGYKVEFISVEIKEQVEEVEDKPEDLIPRPPIVTVMGHVDHGKTSFLDYVRETNVIAGEAGGITQHIGAYRVTLKNGKEITFLDTPGHEAFTAMRARGTQVTDIAIIVIAADDSIMPQTKEAISHALAAGVPIVFAITKIDKPSSNPDKIKQELASRDLLIEEWGGKYGSIDISSKTGEGIDDLLERVLLEAEMLDLKANPKRNAVGTIIESTLDKGRGFVATVLIATGNLKVGDIILAGQYQGRVKAMYNERGQKVKFAHPSHPVLILGLNGAPGAGDKFNSMDDEREAREIANKREQIIRELGQRSNKHITLDEIGRRIAVGNFKELNVILKGDVDGSIEALADSLIKLSTEEIQVNVIHKAVGPIAENDIMLASASDAVIIGFQVRPSVAARRLAEKEGIEIRLYSIIYDAIEELKSAMEGMLSPEIKEEILGSVEVREVFKITKVGTVAGCLVTEGKILRSSKVRIIRDGIVAYTGELGSLKRYKDDVKDVRSGMECGLNIEKYNDIKVGDIIESYQEIEVKKKL